MSKNLHTEMNTIAYLMQEQKPELLVSVLPEYFDTGDLKKIYLLLRKFYTDHSTWMGYDVLRSKVAGSCKTPEKTKFMLSLLDQIQKRDISGLTEDILLEELRNYRKFRLVLDKAQPLIDAVADKDIDAVLGKLKELHDSVFVDEGDQLQDYDMSTMEGKVTFDFKTTGIPPIDERGGLITGGYTIIAAPTGCGKSTLAGMVCLHQYIELGMNIAYFSYEQSAQEIRCRILSNFADIDLGALMSDELSPQDTAKLRRAEAQFFCVGVPDSYTVNLDLTRSEFLEKVYSEFPKRENKFYIFDNNLDWDDLEVKINLLATTKNINTVTLDYPWLVRKGRANSNLADWQYQLEKSKLLKTLARKHSMCLIAPAQLAVGKKNEDPKLKFISNASNDADLVLFLSRTDEDKTLGTTNVHFEKYRNFLTIKDKPHLADFKLLNEMNKARFAYMEY